MRPQAFLHAKHSAGQQAFSHWCRAAIASSLLLLSVTLRAQPATESQDPWLFSSGFEPTGRIEFVTDRTPLFTQAGQSQEFEVRILDDQGLEIPNAVARWELDYSSGLTLQTTGPRSARITVDDWTLGSRMLRVTAGSVGAGVRGQVLMASLQTNAHAFSSERVLEWSRDLVTGVATIALDRDADTEPLKAGDVLLTGSMTEFVEKILTVQVLTDQVVLTTERASLRDAFLELDFTWIGEGLAFEQPGGADQQQNAAEKRSEPVCMIGGQVVPLVEVEPDLPVNDLRVVPMVRLKLTALGDSENFGRFVLRLTGSVTQPSWQFEFGGALVGEVECSFDFPPLVVPTSLPLVSFVLQPRLGFDANISVSQLITVSGPSGRLVGYSDLGLVYADETWKTVEASQWQVENGQGFELEQVSAPVVGIEVSPFLSMDAEILIGARPTPTPSLFDLETRLAFFDLKAALPTNLSIAVPVDPLHRDYTGPKWNIAATLESSLKAELSDSEAKKAFEYFDIPTEVPFGLELLPPVTLESRSSPSISLDPGCLSPCLVPADSTVTVGAMLDYPQTGNMELVAADGDDATVTSLGTSPVLLVSAFLDVMLAPDGRDRALFPRLRVDELSNQLPYASLQSPVVLTTAAGVVPIDHDVLASTRTRTYRLACSADDGDVSDPDLDNPPASFVGTVSAEAQSNSSLPGLLAASTSGMESSYSETGDDFIISMNAVNSSTAGLEAGINCAQFRAEAFAEAYARRRFQVSQPMLYEVQAQCAASQLTGVAQNATGSVSIDVDGAVLFELQCDPTGSTGATAGNGVILPGGNVAVTVNADNTALVGGSLISQEDRSDASDSAVSVTLILTPQN